MPELIVKLGDQIVAKHFLYQEMMTVGRAPDNDLTIENLAISRKHICIRKQGSGYILEDLNSSNGTFVNGVRITKKEIQDKDVISVGKHKIYFYNQDQAAAPLDMNEKTMLVPSTPEIAGQLRMLHGKSSETIYALNRAETRIGRASDNDIVLSDWFVSKYHATIVRKGASFVVRDLESWRHTYVNGEIVEQAVLRPGDEIQIGPKMAMIFELQAEEGALDDEAQDSGDGENAPLPIAAPRGVEVFPTYEEAHGDVMEPAMDEEDAASSDAGFDSGASDPLPLDQEAESAIPGESQAPEPIDDIHLEEEEDSQLYDEESDIFVNLGDQEEEAVPDRPRPIGTEEAVIEAFRTMSDEAASPDHPELKSDEGELQQDEAEEAPEAEAESELESAYNVLEPSDAHELSEWDDDDRLQNGASEAGEEQALDNEDEQAEAWDEESAEAEQEIEHEFNEESFGEQKFETNGAQESSAQDEAGIDSGNGTADEAENERGLSALIDEIVSNYEGEPLDRKEVEMWVRALHNPSQIIRKQAQRKLKKLTGQIYEFPL